MLFGVKLTVATVLKMAASVALGLIGMTYLANGRKDADFGKMVTGAILALVSIFLFAI